MTDSNYPDLLIVSHANCMDGLAAAAVAWYRFRDAAEYIFCAYGDTQNHRSDSFPHALRIPRDIVYVLDFSFPIETLNYLATVHRRIVILDHHKTAQETLETWQHPQFHVVFDMGRSGAGIVWDYFYPVVTRPHAINLVEDRDIWRFKIEGSKEFFEYQVVHQLSFRQFSDLFIANPRGALPAMEAVTEGANYLTYKVSIVEHLYNRRYWGTFLSHEVIFTEAPGPFISDLGERARVACDSSNGAFMVNHSHKQPGFVLLSFRTIDGKTDVSAIAKQLGGGGHKFAAGAEVSAVKWATLQQTRDV